MTVLNTWCLIGGCSFGDCHCGKEVEFAFAYGRVHLEFCCLQEPSSGGTCGATKNQNLGLGPGLAWPALGQVPLACGQVPWQRPPATAKKMLRRPFAGIIIGGCASLGSVWLARFGSARLGFASQSGRFA